MHCSTRKPTLLTLVTSMALALAAAGTAQAVELSIGAATTSITPDKPVALDGQFHVRVSRGVDNPITATAVAIEGRSGGKSVEQAVLVSCDLIAIRATVLEPLRERLRGKLPGFEPRKLILNGTHTHTAPVTVEGKYQIPQDGVMQPREYVAFLVERLALLVTEAWNKRRPGGVSWGLGHAVVGHNRRAAYADGTAVMYGKTNDPNFRHIEGGEDHGLELLYFWDQAKRPLAVGINVACPSQEVESRRTLNADFWHDVRSQLHEGPYKEMLALGWPGAAGDQSPHLMYRKAAEQRMLTLRGLTSTQEIARRIVRQVNDVCQLTRGEIHGDVPFVHKVEDIVLPLRKVTEKEVAEARTQIEALAKRKDTSRRHLWHQAVIDRYEQQKQGKQPPFAMELHVLRIGDVAIATNPFELFLDFGVRMKARSPAVQTFILQLTGAPSPYLPTERAVQGGGYSAVIQSCRVGPEGGQVLVDRTVQAMQEMWKK